jgi:hypothetical protein
MLERLMSAALVTAAACAVMFCGPPQAKVEATPPAIESHAAAAPAPKAEPVAVTDLPFVLTATSTCTCTNCKCKTEPAKAEPAKAAPLYTQPAPVAKPKAAPRPVVRYYYVQPRQQGGCSNGSCGSGGRRGLFGRRR